MSYATWLDEVITNRAVLCELQPAEALSGWAAVGGQPNTYSVSWSSLFATTYVPGGVYRRLDEVRQNNLALTVRTSIALVNANLGSYFFDEAASVLYVSTTTGATPASVASMAAVFSLFFGTEAIDDLGGQLYEPRLTGDLPLVQAQAEETFTPSKTFVDGTITLLNTHGPFDRWAKLFAWKNKRARLLLGGGGLPVSDYQVLATLRLEGHPAVRDDVAIFSVRAQASRLEQTVPVTVLTRTAYPTMADGVEGSYAPLLYGAVKKMPAPCVSSYAVANPDITGPPPTLEEQIGPSFLPAAFHTAAFQDVYLVADPAHQALAAVTGVWARERSTGALVALPTTAYTVNLAACTVTITDYTYRIDLMDILIDARVATETFGAMVSDLLQILGEPAAGVDATSVSTTDAAVPFPLGMWIREPTQAVTVVSQWQQSVLGRVWVSRAGVWTVSALDAATAITPVATLEDYDFARFEPVSRIDPLFARVRCYHAFAPGVQEWQVAEARDDETAYLQETDDAFVVETSLVERVDAELMAQRYRLLAISPDTWIDIDLRGLALMTTEPFDRLSVSRQRAPSSSGSYVDKRLEVIGFEKRLNPPGVSIRVGDLSGIADVLDRVRAWASDAIPDYASASALERTTYAFWHDDNDVVTTGVTTHSVWW